MKKKIIKTKPVDIKYLGIPNICFSLTASDDKREKRYCKQRIKRGFDDSETWSLRDTIAKFILPRLKRYKEVTIGIPGGLSEEEWDSILNKMIHAFEILEKDDFSCLNSKKGWKEYQEGIKLFSKYLITLWW